jgi:hypothetical protein
MPGLDPGIHQARMRAARILAKRMDCRVKPGNDEANDVGAFLFVAVAG